MLKQDLRVVDFKLTKIGRVEGNLFTNHRLRDTLHFQVLLSCLIIFLSKTNLYCTRGIK